MQKLPPFHFKLHLLCTSDFFFSRAPWMIYDVLTPHPTRLHKEQRKTRDWAKLKKKQKQTFKKSRFHLGFSQVTVFYSLKVPAHSKVYPIYARIPSISSHCGQHTTVNFMFGPQQCPGMSNCPDSSPSSPKWTWQLDCINGLISLVDDLTKTLMGVISTRLVIFFIMS